MARIQPVEPPYDPETGEQLAGMMPPGVEPIRLFRTFAKNLPMAAAMGTWGSYELSRKLSLSMRDREILIDRTCARCRCEYEWGVHIAFFAERVGFTHPQIASIAHGGPDDQCWTDERDRLLLAPRTRCTTTRPPTPHSTTNSSPSSARTSSSTSTCCAAGITPSATPGMLPASTAKREHRPSPTTNPPDREHRPGSRFEERPARALTGHPPLWNLSSPWTEIGRRRDLRGDRHHHPELKRHPDKGQARRA